MLKTKLMFFLVILTCASVRAAPGVRVWETPNAFQPTYDAVYAALEDNHFYVVFEPDIGDNLSRFAERWGEDYNRSNLERIRAMVFCNGWYANRVSNRDPDMLALCPLHITLTHKAGVTRVLFVRPGMVAQGSDAEAVADEIEREVSAAVEAALGTLK